MSARKKLLVIVLALALGWILNLAALAVSEQLIYRETNRQYSVAMDRYARENPASETCGHYISGFPVRGVDTGLCGYDQLPGFVAFYINLVIWIIVAFLLILGGKKVIKQHHTYA